MYNLCMHACIQCTVCKLGVCAHGGDGKKKIFTCGFGLISNAPIHTQITNQLVSITLLSFQVCTYACLLHCQLMVSQSADKGSL